MDWYAGNKQPPGFPGGFSVTDQPSESVTFFLTDLKTHPNYFVTLNVAVLLAPPPVQVIVTDFVTV
jgi:hypothetical protein